MAASVRTTDFTWPTGLVDVDITIPGAGAVGPCVGFIFMFGNGTVNGTEGPGSSFHVGFGKDVGANRFSVVSSAETGVGTTQAVSQPTSGVIRGLGPDTLVNVAAFFDSFITDGVRLTLFVNDDSQPLCKAILFFGSDINVVELSLDTSTTDDVEFTAFPGQQTDLLLCCTNHSTVDAKTDDATVSFGVASKVGAAIKQASMTWFDEDSLPTSNVRSAASGSRIASLIDPAGTDVTTAWEVTTLSATEIGITTRIASSTAPAIRMHMLSINFNGAVLFDVGTFTLPTSAGNASITGVGFKPAFMMHWMTHNTGFVVEGGLHDAHHANYVGSADGTEEICVGANSEDNVGTSNCGSMQDNQMVATLDEVGAAEHTATFISFDADGDTLNYTAAPVAYVGFWLAVQEEVTLPTDPEVCTDGRWSKEVSFAACDDLRITIDGPAADQVKISATVELTE